MEQWDIRSREKKNFDPYFALYAKINSNWIIELNVKSKTVKHLEKNQGKNLYKRG